MTFELVAVPPLLGGGLFFDAPDASAVADVLRSWVAWTHPLPEAMTSSMLIARFPEGAPGVPEPVRGRTAVHVRIAHAGDPEEGRRLVRALDRDSAALANTTRPMRPRDGGLIHNEPPGPVSAYDRSLLLGDLEGDGLDGVAGALDDPTAIPVVVEVRHLGGAFARRPPNAAPIAARDAAYSLYTASIIEPGMTVENLRARHDVLHRRVRSHSGSDHLDASVLLMPIMGLVPADDERMLATIHAIDDQLGVDGLVRRWTGASEDEGAFVICSFWLANCLAQAGELARAREVFERVADHANDVGLLAEEIDPRDGSLLGNFPQAFSHVGLITAAWSIQQATERAESVAP